MNFRGKFFIAPLMVLKRRFILVFTTLFFTSFCSKETTTIENEIFSPADRPFFSYDEGSDYFYCLPWNYGKTINSSRKYPLVVYLHASGASGEVSSLNFLGYDSNDSHDDSIAVSFQKNYPCFVLVPQSHDDEWSADKVIAEIEGFKSKYRIDPNRIYLIGYSMGGSGSYIVANGWYDYNKSLFAGIIRLAGQTQTVLRDGISSKTAVWLNIGLEDQQTRIDVTREAYNFLKSKHPAAIETSKNETSNGIFSTTLALTEKNIEIVKETEYTNLGHDVNLIPFEDGSRIKWLFSQKL
jgi:predicted peptidase